MNFQRSTSDTHHCIVVGGGFAGASASVRLAKAGIKVTLIEARADAGGRVQSLLDRTTEETIDNGQHIIMGCYEATLRLLSELGTIHLLRRQEALRVWFGDCHPKILAESNAADIFCLDAAALPGKLGMMLGMITLHGLSFSEKTRLLRFAARIAAHRIRPEGKNAWQLLCEEGQSERVITRLWEPIILATLNAPVRSASAVLFLQVMRLAFLGGRTASQMLFAKTGLAEVLAPLFPWLQEQHGSRVIHKQAAHLIMSDDVVEAVECTDGERINANSVITAVPAHIVHKLLPEEYRSRAWFHSLREIPFSPIVSVYLWTDKDFMEQDFMALLGTRTQWVFNRRRLCHAPQEVRERYAGHYALTISAASNIEQLSSEEIMRESWAELQYAFPLARACTLLHWRVIRERHATPLFMPENLHLRLQSETPVKRLFFAGDWTNTNLPATIESAAYSGERAAEALLRQLGW